MTDEQPILTPMSFGFRPAPTDAEMQWGVLWADGALWVAPDQATAMTAMTELNAANFDAVLVGRQCQPWVRHETTEDAS